MLGQFDIWGALYTGLSLNNTVFSGVFGCLGRYGVFIDVCFHFPKQCGTRNVVLASSGSSCAYPYRD